MRTGIVLSAVCVVLIAWAPLATAQHPAVPTGPAAATPTLEERKAEAHAARASAAAAAIAGPYDVALADEARLHIPKGMAWVPKAQAARLLRAWGNRPGSDLLGLVAGSTGGHAWQVIASLTRDGYVRDDEAKDLNPVKLLATLRTQADGDNKDRLARGFSAVEIGEWMQAPSYDAAAKRLVWALPLQDVGDDPGEGTINYNTRALGRDGYISINLLTDRAHFAAETPAAETLLTSLQYLPGKRYQDFNVSTDHVAEYGLAALIGVVALKKLGLIALGTAFFLKFAKLGLIAVVAAGAALKRLVGRGRGAPGA